MCQQNATESEYRRSATRTIQKAGMESAGAHCVLMIKTLAIHRSTALPEDWPLIERARRIDE